MGAMTYLISRDRGDEGGVHGLVDVGVIVDSAGACRIIAAEAFFDIGVFPEGIARKVQ